MTTPSQSTFKVALNTFRQKLGTGLGKDIVVTLVAQILVMVLGLIINKLLSVKLGVDGYGQYSIIRKSSSVLSFVLLSGMGIALPRFFSMYRAQGAFLQAKSTVNAALLLILTTSIIVIPIGFLLNSQLAPLITGSTDSHLYKAAWLFALGTTFSSFLFAYYRGADSFVQFGISQIAIQLLMAIAAIFFGAHLQLLIYLWAALSIGYVVVALLFEYLKNPILATKVIHWKSSVQPELTTLFRYGSPRMVGDFFLFSLAAVPLIIINQKSGLQASSYFATGITLTALVTPFFGFLGMVLLPHVSSSVARGTFSESDRLIRQLTVGFLVVSILAITVLWTGIDLFIGLFFSQAFLPARAVSRIIVLSIIFEAIYLLLRNPIDAASHFPYNTINLLISLVLLGILFQLAKSLNDFAWSYLAVSAFKAGASWLSWQHCRKRLLLSISGSEQLNKHE